MPSEFSVEEWANTPPVDYNVKEQIKTEIEPLLEELTAKLNELDIPFAIKIGVAQLGGSSETMFLAGVEDISRLSPDVLLSFVAQRLSHQTVLAVLELLKATDYKYNHRSDAPGTLPA